MDIEIAIKYFFGGDYSASKPTLDAVFSNNAIFLCAAAFLLIILIVGIYSVGEKVFGKNKGWKGIIPFYGMYQLFRAVDLNPWLSIAVWIPILGIIPLGVFHFFVGKAFGQKLEICIANIFFPFIILPMLGFGAQYEYQYVKGKNIAFKNDFRTVMPEEMAKGNVTPAALVKGAAIAPMAANASAISRAASAAAEQTEAIRKQQEEKEKAEAEAKAKEEAAKKAEKQNPDDFNYDIFNNNNTVDMGPESSSINFDFRNMNGKFRSTPIGPARPLEPKPPVPAPAPVPAPQPAPAPAPVPAPEAPAAPAAPAAPENS